MRLVVTVVWAYRSRDKAGEVLQQAEQVWQQISNQLDQTGSKQGQADKQKSTENRGHGKQADWRQGQRLKC